MVRIGKKKGRKERRIYEEKEEYVLEKEKFLWVGPRDMTTCKG